jgi:REP element-mobilizing transposase RayT
VSHNSEYVHKSHNVSVLLYHLVCPTKYRRALVTVPVETTLGKICAHLETCYEITFLEIGSDLDHVHFLVHSVPTLSPSRLAQIIKSISARELRARLPGLRDELWGAAFWSSGYFVNTVSRHGNEATIRLYVQQQGVAQDYRVVHSRQLELF